MHHTPSSKTARGCCSGCTHVGGPWLRPDRVPGLGRAPPTPHPCGGGGRTPSIAHGPGSGRAEVRGRRGQTAGRPLPSLWGRRTRGERRRRERWRAEEGNNAASGNGLSRLSCTSHPASTPPPSPVWGIGPESTIRRAAASARSRGRQGAPGAAGARGPPSRTRGGTPAPPLCASGKVGRCCGEGAAEAGAIGRVEGPGMVMTRDPWLSGWGRCLQPGGVDGEPDPPQETQRGPKGASHLTPRGRAPPPHPSPLSSSPSSSRGRAQRPLQSTGRAADTVVGEGTAAKGQRKGEDSGARLLWLCVGSKNKNK